MLVSLPGPRLHCKKKFSVDETHVRSKGIPRCLTMATSPGRSLVVLLEECAGRLRLNQYMQRRTWFRLLSMLK